MPAGVHAVPASMIDLVRAQTKATARQRAELIRNVEQWQDERGDLASYIPAVHRTDRGLPAYPPEHLREIIRAVQDDSLGNTLILAPPGAAKTNTMIAAAAWQLGRDPTQHYGYFSNTDRQAYRRSVAVRDTLRNSTAYRSIFPEVQPDIAKGWAEYEWYLQRPDVSDKDATFMAAGLGSAIMGSRLDRATFDDIADKKNMATAYLREKATSWVTDTALSRLNPNGGRAVDIATRWHVDDPAGFLMKQGWHVVRIRAINELGESYWPARWPLEKLACPNDEHGRGDPAWVATEAQPEPPCWVEYGPDGAISRQGACQKKILGSRMFNLQYQQETTDDESAIFKRAWWRYWDPAERFRAVQGGIFVDLAHSEKTQADYTAIAVWLYAPPNFLVRHVIKVRLEFPEVLALLRGLTTDKLTEDKWSTHPEVLATLARAGRPTRQDKAPFGALSVVIEDTSGSKPLIQTLQRELPSVLPWSSHNAGKLERANATVSYPEAGNVYLWPAPWNQDWVEEHAAFNGAGAEHDDQVDTSTMALLRLTRGGRMQAW